MIIKKYEEVDFLWISSHWDIHLKGLCKERGKLCRFETDDELLGYEENDKQTNVRIYDLSFLEKIKWIFNKKTFEWFVGYHWTYPYREKETRKFGSRRPNWFWHLTFLFYYSLKKAL
tara:strand:- start:143 stop:493 length:351 start_codon:yes stop_codon:yes gene_type:complete